MAGPDAAGSGRQARHVAGRAQRHRERQASHKRQRRAGARTDLRYSRGMAEGCDWTGGARA